MKRFFGIVVLTAIFLCGGCSSGNGSIQDGNVNHGNSGNGSAYHSSTKTGDVIRWQQVDTAMGTVIQQTLYCEKEANAEQISAEIMELLRKLEEEKLSWRLETSEVYRMNASAGNEEGCVLSEDMGRLLRRCEELSEKSGRAFDFTIGAVARLWNIDGWADGMQSGDFVLPSQEALQNALNACGSDRLMFVSEENTGDQEGMMRVVLPEGMQIDLGAAGKGLALSEILTLLQQKDELASAVISVGGSILTYGSRPDGKEWKVGIIDPFDTASYVGFLNLSGQWCISTSGDYERYVELEGIRYHHILDPDTGFPVDSGVRGVTVLTKDGLDSDILSTACFIMGPEEGMALATEYGAETLFVMADGELVMSEGMKAYFSRE